MEMLKSFIASDLKEIRIFSRDEKKQDDMRRELKNHKVKFYIGDVRDLRSVNEVTKELIDLIRRRRTSGLIPRRLLYYIAF